MTAIGVSRFVLALVTRAMGGLRWLLLLAWRPRARKIVTAVSSTELLHVRLIPFLLFGAGADSFVQQA